MSEDPAPPEQPAGDEREGIDGSRVPDAIEPITGFRVWRVDEAGELHSLSGQGRWMPGAWTTAHCLLRDHRAPREGCTCGLYASKNLSLALIIAATLLPSALRSGVRPKTAVVGRVQLAGKVIEHDEGYRAERARIVEILSDRPKGREIQSLASRFAVPIGEEIPVSSIEAANLTRGPHCGYGAVSSMGMVDEPLLSHWRGIANVLAGSLFFGILAAMGIGNLWETHTLEWSSWWLVAIGLGAAFGVCKALRAACRLWASGTRPFALFGDPDTGPADTRTWARPY